MCYTLAIIFAHIISYFCVPNTLIASSSLAAAHLWLLRVKCSFVPKPLCSYKEKLASDSEVSISPTFWFCAELLCTEFL